MLDQVDLIETSDQYIRQMVDSYGYKNTMLSLAKLSGYSDIPPTITEFIDTTHYLKHSLWNEMKDESTIFPLWRNALKEVYPNPLYSPYREVISTGSIGGGKTTFSKIGLLYDITTMMFLECPQFYYGLTKATKLIFAVYSSTLSLAKGVLFDELYEWIKSSPYLSDKINIFDNKKYANYTLFKSNIDIKEGSKFTHTLGQAVTGGLLSELNFQNSWNSQAYNNYTSVKRRIKSRFLNDIPGRMWLDSSKSDSTSFLEGHIRKVSSDPEVIIYDNALWEAKPHEYKSNKTFKVFVGDSYRDPIIIEKPSQIIGLDESKIIDVPEKHYTDFSDDIFSSLQDIAGVSTSAIHKFIPSVEKIEESLIRVNPIYREVIQTDFYDQNDTLISYVDFRKIKYLDKVRFLHIDLGLRNDLAGICSTGIIGFVSSNDSQSLKYPIYFTDFIMAIQAKPGQDIPIYKIKSLITDLRSRGLKIVKVTADGYQSENLKQDMWMLGIKSEIISVDKNKAPYETFKNAILEGRYNGVKHEILSNELKDLLDTGKKIDHPQFRSNSEKRENGSKDCSDAVCGSVYSAFMSMNEYYGSSYDMVSGDFVKEIRTSSENNLYESIAMGA